MKIKAFKGIRPTRDKAHLVASRSYLSYSETALCSKLSTNPYTFLHIINPEQSLGIPPMNGIDKYKRVRDMYLKFRADGVLQKDKGESLYIYRQVSETGSYVGIIAATSVDDYLSGVIKIHEQTIASREEMFTDFLEHTGFNAEPVLLTYPKVPRINKLINSYMEVRPEFEFTTSNKVLHHLWLINNNEDVEELIKLFEGVKAAYVADGHHRSASSMLYSKRKREQSLCLEGDGPHNYFMSFLISDDQMRIFDYNRLIRNFKGFKSDEFLLKINEVFAIQKQDKLFKPKDQTEIGMYFNGSWHLLSVKKHIKAPTERVSGLGVALLSNYILKPIMKVKDIRTDERVDFLHGKHGLMGLQDAVDSGEYVVAFALMPVSVKQLKEVADRNEIMPPKSTYVEPKLRSGMVIYSLDIE